MHDLPAHGADGLVGVRPDVNVLRLATLVREANQQCQVLPSTGTVRNKTTHDE